MTSWALFLLVAYCTLGLSRLAPAKAARVALVITALVVSGVMLRTGAG